MKRTETAEKPPLRYTRLRHDRAGFSTTGIVGALIGVMIALLIGLILLSVVALQVQNVSDDARFTGEPWVPLLDNIGTFFVVGLLLVSIAVVFVALRSSVGGGAGG